MNWCLDPPMNFSQAVQGQHIKTEICEITTFLLHIYFNKKCYVPNC